MSKSESINNNKPLIVQYGKKRNLINELYNRLLGENSKNGYKKLTEDEKSSKAITELKKVFEKNEGQDPSSRLISYYNKAQEQFAKEISPQKKWWHFFRKKSELNEEHKDVKKYANIKFEKTKIGEKYVTTLLSLGSEGNQGNQGKNTAIKMQMYDANGNTDNDLSIVVGIDKKGGLFISAPADIVIDDKTKLNDPVKIRRGGNDYFMPINYSQYRYLHNRMLDKNNNIEIAGINDLARKHQMNLDYKNTSNINERNKANSSIHKYQEIIPIIDKNNHFKYAELTYGVTEESELYRSFVEKEGDWKSGLLATNLEKLQKYTIEKSGDNYCLSEKLSTKLEELKNKIGFSNQISCLKGDYKSINESQNKRYERYEWEEIKDPIITNESIKKTFTEDGKSPVEVTFKSLPGDRATFMLEDIIIVDTIINVKPAPIAIKMPIYDYLGKEVADLNIVVGINKNGNKFVYKNGGEIILDGVKNINNPVKIIKDNQYYNMPISYKQYENFYNEMYKDSYLGNSKIISNSIEKNRGFEKGISEAKGIGSAIESQKQPSQSSINKKENKQKGAGVNNNYTGL